MKIIYYSPHPTHDIVSEVGYSTHQRETIEAMRKLGHEVLPVVLGGTDRKQVDTYHNVITRDSPLKKIFNKVVPLVLRNTLKDLRLMRHDKKAAQQLAAAINLFKPDLVYERNEYLQDSGTLLCKSKGILHFLEVNSPCVDEMRDFEGPSLLHFLGHKKEKNKLNATNSVFTVSGAMSDYLRVKYKVKSRITVHPNCINPDKEKPNAGATAMIRQELNLTGKKVIGFVGSIFPYHGVDKLIDAFALFVHENSDWFLLIIGGGALKEELQTKAESKLPAGSFRFTGKVPHASVMNYINLFDIAVMPASNWYGSPIKVLEYGVMKKPVVAPDNGPLRDIIEHNVTGYLTAENPESICKSFEFLAADMTHAIEMGRKFYEKIMNELTWEKQTQAILQKASLQVPDPSQADK